MPFPSLDRKKYLDSIKADPSKKRGSIQIHYKDDPRYMVDVYEVELKYLIFNQYNDRIAIEVETEEAMSPGAPFPTIQLSWKRKSWIIFGALIPPEIRKR